MTLGEVGGKLEKPYSIRSELQGSFNEQETIEPNEELVSQSKSQKEPLGVKLQKPTLGVGSMTEDELDPWDAKVTSLQKVRPAPLTPKKPMDLDVEPREKPLLRGVPENPLDQSPQPIDISPSPRKGRKKCKR